VYHLLFIVFCDWTSERTLDLVLDETAFNSADMIRARYLTRPGWYVVFINFLICDNDMIRARYLTHPGWYVVFINFLICVNDKDTVNSSYLSTGCYIHRHSSDSHVMYVVYVFTVLLAV